MGVLQSREIPHGLKRFYGAHHLHYITCSCYRRRQLLATVRRRDCFLRVLEQVRERYDFIVVGFVIMPEHFHLLVSEPEKGSPSLVMKALKQATARRLLRRKEIEKLRYMHRNPVKRGLVSSPELWRWSSFRAYAFGERGIVQVNAKMQRFQTPTQRKSR